MATTRIKDVSKTTTDLASDEYGIFDGATNGTQKMSRNDMYADWAAAYVAAPTTYKLAPLNSGTNKIDATYLPTGADTAKGEWNANTNTPTLADGGGTAGDYYDVTTAGSVDLGSGSLTYTVGDVVKYNGTTWYKIDSVANVLDGSATAAAGRTVLEVNSVDEDAEATGTKLVGPEMHFDGTSYIEFAANPALTPTTGSGATRQDTAFSFGTWLKLNDDYELSIGQYGTSAANRGWLLYMDSSSSPKFKFAMEDGSANEMRVTSSDDYFVSGQWTHVAVTCTALSAASARQDDIKIYVNGKEISTTNFNVGYTGLTYSATQPLLIGKRSSTLSAFGQRDFKFFNKALSASEVKTLCLSGQLPESFAESTGGADVVTDGGFENWTTSTDLTDWSERANVSTAQESTDKLSGAYSCKLTGGGDIGTESNNWLRQSGAAFNRNKKYRLSGKVKRFSGSTDALQLGVSYYKIIQFDGTTFTTGPTNIYLPSVGAVTSKNLGNGWYSFSVEFTTTLANTFNIAINGSTDPYLIDDVSIVQIGSVLDARAEQFDSSTGKLYDLSGNDFVGTQSGGVQSLGKKFPVYQTGTWTVGLEFGGSALAVASQTGTWTRIGDLVHIAGAFNLSSISGIGSGNARITGLPFTAEAQTSRHGITFTLTVGMTGLTSAVVGNVLGGDTDIAIYDWGATGTASLTDANFTASTYSRFSGFYQIS